jgi:hypothetical protein
VVLPKFFGGSKASEGTVCTRIGGDIRDWDVLQDDQVEGGRKFSDMGCRRKPGCKLLRALVKFDWFEGLKLVHSEIHDLILSHNW